MKKIYITIISIILVFSANSQIVPEYGIYNQNLMLINPADAGINGGITANLGHKIQWIGFKDAPLNTYFSVDGLLTGSMGLGFIINKQRMGLLEVTNINLNYSYRFAIADQHSFAFGLNMNFLQNKIAKDGLSSYELSDASLISNKFDESLFTNAAGISYRFKDLSIDIASPLLFSYQEHKVMQKLYSYLAYDFYFANDTWRLQPSTLVKYSRSGPFQADFNILADWNTNVWTQFTYSTNNDFTFSAGVFIKYIGIGYAYEMSLKPMSFITSGSHEIIVQFNSPFTLSKKKPLYIDGKNRNTWD
jgi:type IX secretion system PorP/SprF family membrane protein